MLNLEGGLNGRACTSHRKKIKNHLDKKKSTLLEF